jgi:hypothetical protein
MGNIFQNYNDKKKIFCKELAKFANKWFIAFRGLQIKKNILP